MTLNKMIGAPEGINLNNFSALEVFSKTAAKAKNSDDKAVDFNIVEATYKTVHHQDINAYVYVPKNSAPGKKPVIVRFHGGGFAISSGTDQSMFAQWMLDYARANDAILICPEYRMLPESKGTELVQDIMDFFPWMHQSLNTFLESRKATDKVGAGKVADLDKILVLGESAGATCVLLSALRQPFGSIKAIIACYPFMMDFESDKYYSTLDKKKPFGFPIIPEFIFKTYEATRFPGRIITACTPPNRILIMLCMIQHIFLKEYFGTAEETSPLKLIEKVKDSASGKVPYQLIIQGQEDSACDVEDAKIYVAKAAKNLGEGRVDIVIQKGDHGFDFSPEVPLNTPWLRDALKRPTELWLGQAQL